MLADASARACLVYCNGALLAAMHATGRFDDSKTFVDLPLRHDPEHVLAAFDALPPDGRGPDAMRAFMDAHFEPSANSDLEAWEPGDLVDPPPLAERMRTPPLRTWVRELNRLWRALGRRSSAAARAAPQRTSLLPRAHGMIVPGGRFRESYYWDSYWIVLGLLACGMAETARGVVANLLDDVSRLGFVPNGGRCYYVSRSQPPLLAAMVLELWDTDVRAAGGVANASAAAVSELARATPLLERELGWWAAHRAVPERGAPGGARPERGGSAAPISRLSRYVSAETTPRPESFAEDAATSARAPARARACADLRAAAESGWDFSARWLRAHAAGDGADGGDTAGGLATIDTANVVPVDLNCFLYSAERGLARAHAHLAARAHAGASASAEAARAQAEHTRAAERFEQAAAERLEAARRWLWHEEDGRWADFLLREGRPSRVQALSSFAAPLWAGWVAAGGAEEARVLAALESSGLLQPAGAQATVLRTGEQWDAPNLWPPLLHMLATGLDQPGRSERARALGRDVARRWLSSAHSAWRKGGHMYEKYDATAHGHGGGGGEYTPQVGFGWTNGAALDLLRRYAEDSTVLPADEDAWSRWGPAAPSDSEARDCYDECDDTDGGH